MAYTINFSRHIMLNYTQRCCKILQHSRFGNFSAAFHGKECLPLLVQVHPRYHSTENTKNFQLLQAEIENLHKNLETIDKLRKEIIKNDLHLEKVRGDRPSFNDKELYRYRYVSNEMMKHSQSGAEVDKLIKMGEILCSLLNEWYPLFPLKDHPRGEMILSSIEKRVREIEAIITGDGQQPITQTYLSYHYVPIKERWSEILEDTDNPRVKRFIAILEAASIGKGEFCSVLAKIADDSYFDDSEVLPLTEFEPEEIKFAIQPPFDEDYYGPMFWWKALGPDWDCAFKCVTHVLMKPSTEFSA